MDNIKIGKYIAYKRKQKGLTQKELAEILSITDKAISKWERGTNLPDVTILPEIAKIFEISIDELLNGEDNIFTIERQTNKIHSFKITKKIYKQCCIQQLYQKRYWLYIHYILTSLLISGGYAVYSLNKYYPHHLDIFGLLIIILGIGLFVIPIILPILKTRFFDEREYQYTYDKEKLTYIKDGKETNYKYNHFHQIISSDTYYIIINNKEKLFINDDDFQYINKYLSCPITGNISKLDKRIINTKIILSVLSILLSCLELGYLIILKKLDFEIIYNQLEYVIIITVILSILTCQIISKIKNTLKSSLIISGLSFFIIITTWLISDNLSSQKTYFSISPDFSSKLILKQNKETGKIADYHYTYLCFAKKSNNFDSNIAGKITTRWLNGDCNYISYQKPDGTKGIYIATYDDRNGNIQYYSVLNSLNGNWITKNDNDQKYYLKIENGCITIKDTYGTETFAQSEIEQFGTTAVTLFKGNTVKYIIALNKNCIINDDGLIKSNGTIEIVPVFTTKSSSTELFCTTYKEDKEVQQEIDEQMREQALQLVNKMHSLIDNQNSYDTYKSTYDLFKIKTDSKDFVEVTGLAYQKELEIEGDSGVIVNTHGVTLSVKAGSIDDFYVEFSTEGSYELHQEKEISKVNYSYRIIKSHDGYLVAKISYRIPGDIGLVALSPAIDADIINNPLFYDISS